MLTNAKSKYLQVCEMGLRQNCGLAGPTFLTGHQAAEVCGGEGREEWPEMGRGGCGPHEL
jgi:hypothetical protein